MKRSSLFLLAALIAGAGAGVSHADVYKITVENMIPGGPETGQPMTPPVGVCHGPGYTLFAPGDFATDGLEILAEDGVPTDLAGEAGAHPDVHSVVIGDGPFFDSVSFQIEGDPGDLFSVVTMLARSNDLITGVHDVELPAEGTVMFSPTNVYDAGTEENTGLVEHIPFYGNMFVGPDEENPIAMIDSYTVVNDPDQGELVYEFPPSAKVTIENLGATATVRTTWGAVKKLYR
jgi:hypothetical protein